MVLVLLNGEAVIVGLTKTVDVETRAPEEFWISLWAKLFKRRNHHTAYTIAVIPRYATPSS